MKLGLRKRIDGTVLAIDRGKIGIRTKPVYVMHTYVQLIPTPSLRLPNP